MTKAKSSCEFSCGQDSYALFMHTFFYPFIFAIIFPSISDELLFLFSTLFYFAAWQCDVTNLVPKADFGMNTFKKTSVRDIVRAACPSLAEKIPKVSL